MSTKMKLELDEETRLHLEEMKKMLAGSEIDSFTVNSGPGCGAQCMITCAHYCHGICEAACMNSCEAACMDNCISSNISPFFCGSYAYLG